MAHKMLTIRVEQINDDGLPAWLFNDEEAKKHGLSVRAFSVDDLFVENEKLEQRLKIAEQHIPVDDAEYHTALKEAGLK